ncbi:ATP-binding protein [Citrobacter cronae]|uniref:AAA family ATPase n=1 Tax=Citrobacter TaxID=544 RepID=UPI000A0FB3F4|nr:MULTISPECIES: AAA family ATPase [Citrobacter]MBS6076526.1 ATP-binding protein [Citrobacter freundii]NBD81488.1 AAA family ATPase [Citrobacter werkmanii]ORT74338.1 AAA family ATPase [Citrobacter werkmanii]OSP21084.1 AAA family ATPase [Citrobacter werkmanii]UQX60306.1 ATP-binding protein [Citrobacter sp. XT1-2-2]
MSKFLMNINGAIPGLIGNVGIDISGKNLIITGGNGCGKTTFLNEIRNKLTTLLIDKNVQSIENLKRNLEHWKNSKNRAQKGSNEYYQAVRQIELAEGSLKKIQDGLQLEFTDKNELSILLNEGKAIINFFTAIRKAEIQPATGANKVKRVVNSDAKNQSFGNTFEQHLVNLKTRQSFAKTFDNDMELYKSIDAWFDGLEKNIAFLMEDDTFELKFEPDDFKFYLNQKDKKPYTFQTLSSGYSAIFNIISELIMKTEAYKISPSELQGIVMIDEIDAHLHVSLQRKILPFLTKTYPLIQFIITTHSPFVIGSLDDSVVYDLGSKQQFKELSNYSYETIIEGLLGVPVVSISLEKDIKRLSILINEKRIDMDALSEIVNKLLPYKEKLDDESAIFLLKGATILKNNKDCA